MPVRVRLRADPTPFRRRLARSRVYRILPGPRTPHHTLAAVRVRDAKPREKPYKLSTEPACTCW